MQVATLVPRVAVPLIASQHANWFYRQSGYDGLLFSEVLATAATPYYLAQGQTIAWNVNGSTITKTTTGNCAYLPGTPQWNNSAVSGIPNIGCVNAGSVDSLGNLTAQYQPFGPTLPNGYVITGAAQSFISLPDGAETELHNVLWPGIASTQVAAPMGFDALYWSLGINASYNVTSYAPIQAYFYKGGYGYYLLNVGNATSSDVATPAFWILKSPESFAAFNRPSPSTWVYQGVAFSWPPPTPTDQASTFWIPAPAVGGSRNNAQLVFCSGADGGFLWYEAPTVWKYFNDTSLTVQSFGPKVSALLTSLMTGVAITLNAASGTYAPIAFARTFCTGKYGRPILSIGWAPQTLIPNPFAGLDAYRRPGFYDCDINADQFFFVPVALTTSIPLSARINGGATDNPNFALFGTAPATINNPVTLWRERNGAGRGTAYLVDNGPVWYCDVFNTSLTHGGTNNFSRGIN